MTVLSDSSRRFYLGKWSFNEIEIGDIDLYSEFIKRTEYPANLWTSNFPYLWATSKTGTKKKLWKIVDDMLVTFTYMRSGKLHMTCLPFGKGDSEKLIDVIYRCLSYCYKWNNYELSTAVVKTVNSMQSDFLRNRGGFDKYFRLKPLGWLEKHFSIQKLVALQGKEFETIRRKINKFHRICPNAIIREYTPEDYKSVIKLGKVWAETSGKKYMELFDEGYFPAIIKHYRELKQTVLVVENERSLIGMVSGGELPNGQSWWSISKFVNDYDGLSELLVVELAKAINKANPNIEIMNAAVDFGPGGLCFFKERFRPVLDLKRYTIKLK